MILKKKTLTVLFSMFVLVGLIFGVKGILAGGDGKFSFERQIDQNDPIPIADCNSGAKQCADINAQFKERTCDGGSWSEWTGCCSTCNCGPLGRECTPAA